MHTICNILHKGLILTLAQKYWIQNPQKVQILFSVGYVFPCLKNYASHLEELCILLPEELCLPFKKRVNWSSIGGHVDTPIRDSYCYTIHKCQREKDVELTMPIPKPTTSPPIVKIVDSSQHCRKWSHSSCCILYCIGFIDRMCLSCWSSNKCEMARRP